MYGPVSVLVDGGGLVVVVTRRTVEVRSGPVAVYLARALQSEGVEARGRPDAGTVGRGTSQRRDGRGKSRVCGPRVARHHVSYQVVTDVPAGAGAAPLTGVTAGQFVALGVPGLAGARADGVPRGDDLRWCRLTAGVEPLHDVGGGVVLALAGPVHGAAVVHVPVGGSLALQLRVLRRADLVDVEVGAVLVGKAAVSSLPCGLAGIYPDSVALQIAVRRLL